MNSQEYKAQLEKLIDCLPEAERSEAVAFYMEAISDRIDDGATEEEAVASIATPAEAARAIISEKIFEFKESGGDTRENEMAPESRSATQSSIASDKEQNINRAGLIARLKNRKLTPLEWVAVIVTSPLWLPLLAAAFVIVLAALIVAFTLLLCAWILVGCVWIVGAAFVAASPLAIVFAIWGIQIGNVPYSIVNVGYALFLFGTGMWALKGARALTLAFYRWMKKNLVAKARGLKNRKTDEAMQADSTVIADIETFSTEDATHISDDAQSELINKPVSQPDYREFYRVCLILLLIGIGCVLVGFIISGFDWRIFMTSFYSEGKMYLGGVEVTHPENLLFPPYILLVP